MNGPLASRAIGISIVIAKSKRLVDGLIHLLHVGVLVNMNSRNKAQETWEFLISFPFKKRELLYPKSAQRILRNTFFDREQKIEK